MTDQHEGAPGRAIRADKMSLDVTDVVGAGRVTDDMDSPEVGRTGFDRRRVPKAQQREQNPKGDRR